MKPRIYLVAIGLLSALGLKSQTIMNVHENDGTILQIPLNIIDSITYTISNPGNLAVISTIAVSSISETTAISGGDISYDGGTLITQRGICYSTSPSPTTANSTVLSSSGTNIFTCNLTGLTANTTYYVRAYAINSAGTAYGNELSFTTVTGTGGIVSNPGAGVTFNGYNYSSIVLGNGQEWMAENLRTTSYANGDPIPNVTSFSLWTTLTSGAWTHYNNDSQYETPYGKLYNWYTINDSRNICPSGWHVPNNGEWDTLINYLDSSAAGGLLANSAGGKMKSLGTLYWQNPNANATNESGFSGFPGGSRNYLGFESYIGHFGTWWSSTEGYTYDAYVRILDFSNGFVHFDYEDKRNGFSVRCIKD
jgi:uncharacterized protein (TIGR02145 family)